MNNLAFIFPGQGSQKVGMLADAATEFPIIAETFQQASSILGYDLWALVQNGPQEELNLTERTQPMLLTASVALWRAWSQQSKIMPAFMAGHSLGEWSALVCAGVVDFKDAVRLVQLRGKYMQEAVPVGVGSMAAIIGLDDAAIIDCCRAACENEVVSAVNFNSPGQVVIAGNKAAVDRACLLCKEKGAKRAQLLAVSAPFHSSLLKPAADRLAKDIDAVTFNSPTIPVVHNVDASTETNPARIKELMIEQIYHPVLWVDCVGALVKAGIDTCVECGPGKVLSGLTKRIDRSVTSLAIESPDTLNEATSLLST
jgi:[acyl-carrier-protein] S-malonyltransferase